MSTPQATINPDMIPKVIDGLVAIRDKLAAAKQEYDAKVADLKAAEERGENWLLQAMQQLGLDQVKAAGGTAFVQVKPRTSIGDWNAFADWVAETGEVDLLQHRINEANLKEYLASNNQQLPPGISTSPVRTVTVRRA